MSTFVYYLILQLGITKQSSEVTSHIIHLVHSSNNIHGKSNETNAPTSLSASAADETDLDLDNELTPNSSYLSSGNSSSSESTSSSESSTPSVIINNSAHGSSQIQNDLNNYFFYQQRQQSLPPKEQYNQILTNLTRWVSSFHLIHAIYLICRLFFDGFKRWDYIKTLSALTNLIKK